MEEEVAIEEIEEKTRIEDLIPGYSELSFIKEDISKETEEGRELDGMDNKDKVVWKQLVNQLNLANKRFERDRVEYDRYIEEREGLKDFPDNQKAERAMDDFGGMLAALDGERTFLLSILKEYLKEYLNQIKKLEDFKIKVIIMYKEVSRDEKEYDKEEEFLKKLKEQCETETIKIDYETILKELQKKLGIDNKHIEIYKRKHDNKEKIVELVKEYGIGRRNYYLKEKIIEEYNHLIEVLDKLMHKKENNVK